MQKKWLGVISAIVLVAIVGFFMLKDAGKSEAQEEATEQKEKSKNLIVLIGDGMGIPQVTLSRIYAQQYLNKDRLFIDDYLVGTNSTNADRNTETGESGIVTDSAASGTAFATGNKTYNGAIAVTNEEVARPVASILEAAQHANKATGLISTARITHATPAVYMSHVRSRNNENAIASQYATSGIDVLLGGGERHFVATEEEAMYGKTNREDGVNLMETFEKEGYDVVRTKDDLMKADGEKLIGFFSNTHIPYNLDRDEAVPTLKEQFEAAVKVLEKNDEGFVIMIEGGRIDHAGHANDLHSVVQEMLEFDEVFQAAIEYAQKQGDTSVIATADHETGGLTIGSQNIYDAYLDVFEKVTASSETIGPELEEAETDEQLRAIVKKYTSIDDLETDEMEILRDGLLWDRSVSSYGREGAFNAIIAKRGIFGWTGHGHTGVDVGVYGYGPAAELLRGFNDNTDFAKAGAEALGLNLEEATKQLQERYAYPKFMENDEGVPLFPMEPLAQFFDWTYDGKIAKNNGVEIAFQNNEAQWNGESVPTITSQEQLYVPFEVVQALTKQELEWDSLSERIVLQP